MMNMIDKKQWYKAFEPFKNKHLPIFFFFKFGNQKQYCIVFDWNSSKSNGDFNPMMYAQLKE